MESTRLQMVEAADFSRRYTSTAIDRLTLLLPAVRIGSTRLIDNTTPAPDRLPSALPAAPVWAACPPQEGPADFRLRSCTRIPKAGTLLRQPEDHLRDHSAGHHKDQTVDAPLNLRHLPPQTP